MPLQSRMSLMELTQSAVVDLQETPAFSEPFFVVVIEKEQDSESNQNESFNTLNSHTQNEGEIAEGFFFFSFFRTMKYDNAHAKIYRLIILPENIRKYLRSCMEADHFIYQLRR